LYKYDKLLVGDGKIIYYKSKVKVTLCQRAVEPARGDNYGGRYNPLYLV